MRALVIPAPGVAEVQDVPAPEALGGDVVVDVVQAGICGTDIELYTGEMAYFAAGFTRFPLRIGHEWTGVVASVGDGVDASLVGRRVTGDTMLGCKACVRCAAGRDHVCEFRGELGVRSGRPGAIAEQVAVPASSLHLLPDAVSDTAAALVEPGANAFRSVEAADLASGERLLITGAGTIGLLCALLARARGVEVHLLARSVRSQDVARSLGFEQVWTLERLPALAWDAVIEASNAPDMPARAARLVEPGRRVVYVGLAGSASLVDSRDLALADVTAVGVLSGFGGFAGTIEAFASGAVDPTPLVAATVSLDDLPAILAGSRPAGAGIGPKFHVRIND